MVEKTSGVVDEFVLQQIMKKTQPLWYRLISWGSTAVLFILAAVASLHRQVIPAGTYLIFAMLIVTLVRRRDRKEASRSVAQMQKISGKDKLIYETELQENGIYTNLKGTNLNSFIPYVDLAKIIDVGDIIVVVSKKGESAYIFKNCMSSEKKDTLLHQLEDKIKTP